jgi:hypothetical protein
MVLWFAIEIVCPSARQHHRIISGSETPPWGDGPCFMGQVHLWKERQSSYRQIRGSTVQVRTQYYLPAVQSSGNDIAAFKLLPVDSVF